MGAKQLSPILSQMAREGPYAFKFQGLTLWLVTKNADAQAAIDGMNPNCPRYEAHATLHYNTGPTRPLSAGSFQSFASGSGTRDRWN